ncbi:hypothetical protein IOC47_23130 [Enterobacter cloacae]|uniref:hypothetical protein n=1 Tax=Enterobacter cloacae complex TaxID=354276 RepID=UPI001E5BECFC|nr:hypothetical protein [Enterobacter cloacae]MCD1394697.1 hypothetical protein [Enterobacter cloacae]
MNNDYTSSRKERIEPQTVMRDETGAWHHPVWLAFIGGRKFVSRIELHQWLRRQMLEYTLSKMMSECCPASMEEYRNVGTFRTWSPMPPAGPGWFTGAIYHSYVDGPVCVWLRYTRQEHAANKHL